MSNLSIGESAIGKELKDQSPSVGVPRQLTARVSATRAAGSMG